MEKNITGGCVCGAIKYETKAKPEFSIIFRYILNVETEIEI